MARNENTISLDISIMMRKDYHFTKENIDDLMVTALEGGISGWAISAKEHKKPDDLTGVNHLSDYISRGGELIIHTVEGEKLVLNHEKFMVGLEMAIRDMGARDVEIFMDNHDADTADNIIQYALFDSIIFA